MKGHDVHTGSCSKAKKGIEKNMEAMPGIKEIPLLPMFQDAIQRIKLQKQRPGFDRLAQTLKTHHQLHNTKEIKEQLSKAVENGLLLTVWTKGLQCYKDSESLIKLRKYSVGNSAEVKRAVKAAVREIGDPEGSPLDVVVNYVEHSFKVKPEVKEILVDKVGEALTALVQKRNLRAENDRYRFACSAPGKEPLTEAEDEEPDGVSSDNGSMPSAKRTLQVDVAPRRKYTKRKTAPIPHRYADGHVDQNMDDGSNDFDIPVPVDDGTGRSADLAGVVAASQPGMPPQVLHSSNSISKSDLVPAKSPGSALLRAVLSTSPFLPVPVKRPRGRPPKSHDQGLPAQPRMKFDEPALRPQPRSPPKFTSLFPPKEAIAPPVQTERIPENSPEIALEHEPVASSSTLEPRPAFLTFQCWCCSYYTASVGDFEKHVKGPEHARVTAGRRVVCARCNRNSRDGKSIIAHLTKHKFHEFHGGSHPACLLKFTSFGMLTDSGDVAEGSRHNDIPE